MALSAKAAKMLSRGSKADDRVSRFLDLPGYDESTEMAQREVARAKAIEKAGGEYAVRYRELAKKEKDGTLTRDEKRELSSMLSPKEEKGMDRATKRFMENKGMGKAEKLSEKEKKQMQESLEFSKGGAVKKKKKMMGGGYASKPTMAMAKGGYANCGASMKPNGPKKGK